MHRVILFIVCILVTKGALAYDFAVGGIYYNVIDSEKKELEVAPLSVDPANNNNAYVGKVEIPEFVGFGNYMFKVTSIGANAFSYCMGLTDISLPSTIVNLGAKCFEGCTGLMSISFPSSLSIIGAEAFSGCSSLNSLHFIENSVSEIQAGAFANCKSLGKVTLPYGLSLICGEAFSGCSSLREIVIPSSVSVIGTQAFHGCFGLLDVTLPLSVTKVESFAFEGCSGLSSIYIPETTTEIGFGAFKGCDNLQSIEVATSNPSYVSVKGFLYDKEKISLHTCPSGYVGEISILNSTIYICDYAFSGCRDLSEIIIPKNVKAIGSQAFADCRKLSLCSVPNSVFSIGERAFENTLWYKLQPNGVVYAGQVAYCYKGEMPKESHIELKEGTVGIADCAFQKCTNLTSIILTSKLATIGFAAFDGCTNLMSIDIPKSISVIGDQAFYNCVGLSIIHCRCTSLPSIGNYSFYQCNTDGCILYVPSKMKGVFEMADVWKDFKNIRTE